MARPKRFECEHCHKPFLSPHKKKFCSSFCLKKGRKKFEEPLNSFIVNKLLKNPKAIWKDKNARFRELKFDADSLAWYIAPQGWAYLKVEYAKFGLDLAPRIRHNIPDVKVGDDKAMSKKTTNIKDFINYGSKKENN